MRKFSSTEKTCGWQGVYAMLEKKYGLDQTEVVFQKADALLKQYEERYHAVKGIRKMHVSASYTTAALYLPLKELIESRTAVKMIAEGAKPGSLAKKDKLMNMPGSMYLSLCRMMTKIFFGPKAGFQYVDHSKDKSEVRFDMLKCLYCDTLKELGCIEVCSAICVQDEYSYKGLKNSVFERTKTLGNGDDCCDFCYRLKQPGE